MGNQTHSHHRNKSQPSDNNFVIVPKTIDNSQTTHETHTKHYSSNCIDDDLLKPNNKNITNQNVKTYKYMINYSDLIAAFKHFSVDGNYLNLERFNDCIAALLKFDIPLVYHTYLSEKLFNLMDKVHILIY
jgi:hypothetical protein